MHHVGEDDSGTMESMESTTQCILGLNFWCGSIDSENGFYVNCPAQILEEAGVKTERHREARCSANDRYVAEITSCA
jgi:hypothetical protein